MKKVILACIFMAISILSACTLEDDFDATSGSIAQPPTLWESQTGMQTSILPTEEINENASLERHSFEELGFYLDFPASWKGRYTINRSESSITVIIDGATTFTIYSDSNTENASDRAKELYSDGYEYFCENYDRTFYLRLLGEFPEDLSWHDNGPVGAIPTAKCDVLHLFSYQTVASEGTAEFLAFYMTNLYPENNNYRNYRLGINLDFPESWAGLYQIRPFENRLIVSVRQNDGMPESPIIYMIYVQEEGSSTVSADEIATSTLICRQNGKKYYLRDAITYDSNLIEQYAPILDDPMSSFDNIFSVIF